MRLQEFMTEYPNEVKRMRVRMLGIDRTFTVLEMKGGDTYVETETVDEEGITTIEVLRNSVESSEPGHFTIVWRERHGENHNNMRSYPRDNQYPLFSVVKLDAGNS
jgi:hypothetical protein